MRLSQIGFLASSGGWARHLSICAITRSREVTLSLNTTNDRELRAALYAQIGRSHVIVIPMGMYAHYSKWI
jgi:hypothetical protein